MDTEIDPIQLESSFKETIERYIKTALPIHPKHKNFSEKFNSALQKKFDSGELVRGPFVECLDDFEKGATLADLVEESVLHEDFKKLGVKYKLHRHQEEAIRAVCERNENIVVSTGTGSGKTECFLYPLANKLLRSPYRGKPGIRAVVIYPMNALANDQLYSRIAPIFCAKLKDSGITIGRYTGETQWAESTQKQIATELLSGNSVLRDAFGDTFPHQSWLLTREEMIKNPPNILITNYAMLEHLLLLPRNRGLFENGVLDLQFLILDEIHTYRGSQASDVSMLLRKLLLRYGNKHTQCIGTSASLSNDEISGRRPEDFAEELFSRKFTRTITGTRLVHSSLRDACPSVDWSAREWVLLKQKIETFGKEEVLTETVLNSISNCPQIGKSEIEKILFENLPKIKSFVELSTTLHSKQTVLLRGLMNIFPCDKEQDVLSALHAMVSLGAIARNSSGEFPLLPAKYHFFIGNIQGVYVSFNSSGEIKELHLEEPSDREKYYSIKTCRSCGSLYIELFCNGRKAYSSRKTLGGSLLSRKTYLLDSDEEVIYYSQSEDENDNGEKRKVKRWSFKPATGDLKEDETPLEGEISLGEVEMQKEKTVAGEETNNWVVKTCPICGSSDSDEIVTSFCPGDFAYSEVITDGLYEALPDAPNNANKPGNGRKLLVFNDNRQDCAYFAPVHQDRHQRIVFLNRLLKIITQGSPDTQLHQEYEKYKSMLNVPFETFIKHFGENLKAGLSISSICCRLIQREPNFILGMTPDFLKKPSKDQCAELQARVLAEIAIPGNVRSGLIGKGLIKVEYANLTDATVEPICNKLGIEKGKAIALFKWFLDEIRIRRAVSMPDGVLSDNKEVWGNYAQKDRSYSLTHYQGARFSIIPASSHGNVFSKYIEKLSEPLNLRQGFNQIANTLWRVACESGHLIDGPTKGTNKVLDSEKILLCKSDSDDWCYCSKCRRLFRKDHLALSDICPRSNCRGKLVLGLPQNSEYNKENHYINLYTRENPLQSMQVREHSAALTTKEREELECDFRSFDVNVLSCTTTMEMGIDLGDLNAVLLRNLPPDISNYLQRVGRAGRRGQATPVAVTILRNRRFDLLVGKNIQGDFLLKQPSMPIVKIQNPVILRRHQNALILAEYLKEKGIGAEDPKKSITLEMLFENTGAHHDVPQAGIQNAIKLAKTIFPFQFKFEESEDLTNEKVVVQNFVTDFEFARKKYESLRDELENDWKNLCEQRKSSDGVLKTLKNLKSKLIIEFLSKNGVLPTYSFPVDNVELLLGESRFDCNSITRDATVGINEYAPGASIVANGKEWVSQGVKVGVKEFLETRLYRICKFCGKIDSVQAELGNTSLASQKLGTVCSRCGKNPQSRNKIYIVPKTFYTKESGRPKTSRVIPPLAMEVKLIASWEAEDFENWGDVKTLLVPAQKGEMVKINQGCKWGFYWNRSTGEMKRKLKQFEKSPKGFRSDSVVDLAHQFRCDVLLIKIKSSEIKEAGFLETLVETLRIGAAKYLNINEQELGSSIETINVDGYDEISIFDNVSGGAGYVASCTKKIPQLFESARRVINCECESGCLKCLRSYSNQHYWDFFSRKSKDAVRSFLERVRIG